MDALENTNRIKPAEPEFKNTLRSVFRNSYAYFERSYSVVASWFTVMLSCIAICATADSPSSNAQAPATFSVSPNSGGPRTVVEIPPEASVEEAWSIIGTAIANDDKLTFRAHSTSEVYDLVVRPRDLNATEAVVIGSHWDVITNRIPYFNEYPNYLPESPAPGKCSSGTTPSDPVGSQAEYTCDFTSDGKWTVAHFYLSEYEGSWVVVNFLGLYG